MTPGPWDQRTVESRPDVLVYPTPPFKQDVEMTGPVTLELYISSSALDTDFTGKLIDVSPDGYGKISVKEFCDAYRNSMEHPTLMHPGEIYKVTIDLWSTSNVFLAGHQLRVEISSSNFPRVDRNMNTGADVGSSSAQAEKAANAVYHDRDHASALIVPVVP